MAKNRPSNASQAPASAKKTPATPAAAAKPAAASNKKQQQQASAKKEDQPPAKKAKVVEAAPEESESEEDEQELSTLMAAEDDSEEDEEDDDELSQFFEVPEYVYETTYVSFQLPPQGNVTVMSQPGAVVTLKSATLGYEVNTGSRSVLIASVSNASGNADECNEDDEDEEHEHDHDGEEDIENLVLGTMLPNVCENLALDVTFAGDFMLNNVSDVNPMYIVAVIDPAEDDDEEIDSDDDEDEGALLDADAEDSEDDEDKQVVNKLFEASKAAAPAAKKVTEAVAPKKTEAAAPKPVAAAQQPVADKKVQHKEAKKEAKKDVAITNKPTVNDVVDFAIAELKQNKGTVKQTDMGTGISKRFGTGVKQMGFEEKTLSKLLEVHAKGKVNVTADAFKLPK